MSSAAGGEPILKTGKYGKYGKYGNWKIWKTDTEWGPQDS
jgi:hypothetical protein